MTFFIDTSNKVGVEADCERFEPERNGSNVDVLSLDLGFLDEAADFVLLDGGIVSFK